MRWAKGSNRQSLRRLAILAWERVRCGLALGAGGGAGLVSALARATTR